MNRLKLGTFKVVDLLKALNLVHNLRAVSEDPSWNILLFVHLKILQISILSVGQDWFGPCITFNSFWFIVLETKPHVALIIIVILQIFLWLFH